MGAYFLIVNRARKQYLDPIRFGEAIKFTSFLRGEFCLYALKQLISDYFTRNQSSFRGAWLGDPIIFASDDTGLPNPGLLVTSTAEDPQRNLSDVAKAEYADISYLALAEICLEPQKALELAEMSREDSSLLVNLGLMLEQYRVKALALAIEDVWGMPWRKVFNGLGRKTALGE